MTFTERLKAEAATLGFHLSGACPAVEPTGFNHLLNWIDAGMSGEMSYIDNRRDAYQHPRHVMEGVKSLLVLGFPYRTDQSATSLPGHGRIARYAWGEADYHDLIHARLKQLRQWILQQRNDSIVRGVVDTAPLLEREFATLAGIGWRGKNTMLINKWQGSYFFLASLLVDFELDYDTSHASDHCGTCRACLDACPTGAFPEPGVLDATRCISYLTIEHRTPVDRDLRTGIGDWLFGCDICQDVCPWNRRGSDATDPTFAPRADQNPMELASLFSVDDDTFRQRFRKTPLWRSKRRGILRNAAIVLGNSGDRQFVECLGKGLNDDESLVRGASAWALGQLAGQRAADLLAARIAVETDPEVCAEIASATQEIC